MEIRQLENVAFNTVEDSMGVSGYVNEVGKLSQPMRDKKGRIFREKIEKGVFKRAIDKANAAGRPIKLLFRHNSKDLLASTKNASLSLEEDEVGLRFDADIVNTTLGKDVHEYVKTGLISNMSFGFIKPVEEWSIENGQNIRTLKDFELTEISILDNPAYLDSSVKATREISLIEDLEVPDLQGDEPMEKEIQEKVEEKRAYLDTAYSAYGAKRICFDCLAALYSLQSDGDTDYFGFSDEEENSIETVIDVLTAKLKVLNKNKAEKREDGKSDEEKETASTDKKIDSKKKKSNQDEDEEDEDKKSDDASKPKDDKKEDKKSDEKRSEDNKIIFTREELNKFIDTVEKRAYTKMKIETR